MNWTSKHEQYEWIWNHQPNLEHDREDKIYNKARDALALSWWKSMKYVKSIVDIRHAIKTISSASSHALPVNNTIISKKN